MTSTEFRALYDDYYAEGKSARKREVAAIQSVEHLEAITRGETFDRVLDIGAGEGSVLNRLSQRKFAKSLAAVEISRSGLTAIHKKSIPELETVQLFDGYKIPHADKSFDLGLAIHVVEHVEHERLFLHEAARVCEKIYVEVPLEHTRNLERAIRVSGQFGHINFYTPRIFENLLRTSALKVERTMVFAQSLPYEQHLAGNLRGWLKYRVRRDFLRVAPKIAIRNMSYMFGALCSSASR